MHIKIDYILGIFLIASIILNVYLYSISKNVTLITQEKVPTVTTEIDSGEDTKFNLTTAQLLYNKELDKEFYVHEERSFYRTTYVPKKITISDPYSGHVYFQSTDQLTPDFTSYEILDKGKVLKFYTRGGYFYSLCMSCALTSLEFWEFDVNSDQYINVNAKYPDEYSELLNEYEDIAKNKCVYGGNVMSVNEIISTVGKDVKCTDDIVGNNSSFISVGEFMDLKDQIEELAENK